MEEERTYINYWQAIENVAYAMWVLHTYADAGNCEGGNNAALSAAYTRLERVMEALQDGGVVAID